MSDQPRAATEIRHAVTRLAHRLRMERPQDGLSTSKLGVLGHLYRRGPAPPSAIAAAERYQPQSLTRLAAELLEAGLITKARGTTDRRQVLLAISPAGLLALRDNMAGRDAWLGAALLTLTDTERALLRLAAPLLERLAMCESNKA